jgi:type IV pilus assembly protein PilX
MNQFKLYRQHRRGFVLMVSLVMVIAITGIAVSLLSSSSMDIKMATAAEDREMATHISRGGNDQLYYDAVNRTIGSRNYFAAFATSQDAIDYTSAKGAVSTVSWLSDTPRTETDCPRSKDPTEGLQCIYLQATTLKTFGPNDANQINVVSGIAQQVGVK